MGVISLYICVFLIMGIIKFMQIVFKKDMENIWIRMNLNRFWLPYMKNHKMEQAN